MWIGFSIYRAFTQSPPANVPAEISLPLNPTLDSATIGKIESALFFNESQIPAFTITSATTPAPSALPTPVATAQPSASPSATPVGTPFASPTP